jgi:hypothetical protein
LDEGGDTNAKRQNVQTNVVGILYPQSSSGELTVIIRLLRLLANVDVNVGVGAAVDAIAAIEVAAEPPIIMLRNKILLLCMKEASSREMSYQDKAIRRALVAECLVSATRTAVVAAATLEVLNAAEGTTRQSTVSATSLSLLPVAMKSVATSAGLRTVKTESKENRGISQTANVTPMASTGSAFMKSRKSTLGSATTALISSCHSTATANVPPMHT